MKLAELKIKAQETLDSFSNDGEDQEWALDRLWQLVDAILATEEN